MICSQGVVLGSCWSWRQCLKLECTRKSLILCTKGHQVPAFDPVRWLGPPGTDTHNFYRLGTQWILIVRCLKKVATTFGSASIFPLRSVHQRASGTCFDPFRWLGPPGMEKHIFCRLGTQWILIVQGLKNVATTFGSASIFQLRFVHQRASGPVLTHLGTWTPWYRKATFFAAGDSADSHCSRC